MATAASRLLTVEEFLALSFDPDCKAELSNGVIHVTRMMGGGSGAHARVRSNIFGTLFIGLRGSRCRPYGSDMGLRPHELSLRYPDVSVFCGRDDPANDRLQTFNDPKVVVEVLSPSTRHEDLDVKLPEYLALSSLDAIVYVDPDRETVRLLTRTGQRGWSDATIEPGDDTMLETVGIALAWSDIFARF